MRQRQRPVTAASEARRAAFLYGDPARALAAHRSFAWTATGRRALCDPDRKARYEAVGECLRRLTAARH